MTEALPEKNNSPQPTLELMATLYTLSQLEAATHDMPQIALVCRSNVGKSSLINALDRRKKLARVSAEPGKTRSVNIFKVNPYGFCLTDLPGYGYARRSQEERRNWAALIQKYLENTPTLKALVLLIDCRVPVQESDRAMAEFARAGNLPIIAVLTKTDKCTLKEKSAQQSTWAGILGTRPLLVSSVSKLGIGELWQLLLEYGQPPLAEEAPSNPSEAE